MWKEAGFFSIVTDYCFLDSLLLWLLPPRCSCTAPGHLGTVMGWVFLKCWLSVLSQSFCESTYRPAFFRAAWRWKGKHRGHWEEWWRIQKSGAFPWLCPGKRLGLHGSWVLNTTFPLPAIIVNNSRCFLEHDNFFNTLKNKILRSHTLHQEDQQSDQITECIHVNGKGKKFQLGNFLTERKMYFSNTLFYNGRSRTLWPY